MVIVCGISMYYVSNMTAEASKSNCKLFSPGYVCKSKYSNDKEYEKSICGL